MTTQAQRLYINESVTHTVLDGEAVLLNTETGVYFGLDEVGTGIWEQLMRGATRAEIVAQVLADYDVSAACAQADVSAFLGELAARGLTSEVSSEVSGTVSSEVQG